MATRTVIYLHAIHVPAQQGAEVAQVRQQRVGARRLPFARDFSHMSFIFVVDGHGQHGISGPAINCCYTYQRYFVRGMHVVNVMMPTYLGRLLQA